MQLEMNFSFLLITIQLVVLLECAILPSPNKDDKQYWHNYSIKNLQRVMKINGIDKGSSVPAKNVIIFVGDGMSFSTVAAGRILKGQLKGAAGEETDLVFESFPHIGLAKVYNIDKQVPDSAGTATALFTGIKAFYSTIGLNPPSYQSTPEDRLPSIMDWAQKANKRTGIVTNTRITHATPAATYAYSANRNYECDTKVPVEMRSSFKDIGRQLAENAPGKNFNVIFGGGRDFMGSTIAVNAPAITFNGSTENSCSRTDKIDLTNVWLSNKTNTEYINRRGDLFTLKYDRVESVMGLFANNHMSYNMVRNNGTDGEPSLTEMTEAAIKVLNNKYNKAGFVLMVEGGRIDQAHHQNLAHLALDEFIEFEKAIDSAIKMTQKSDDTLIIVTSDHGHGMVFNGYPNRGGDILGVNTMQNLPTYETMTYATGPGFWKHNIPANTTNGTTSYIRLETPSLEQRLSPSYMHLSAIPTRDAVHSGEDVGVYAIGHGSHMIQGVFEQSYIAYAISYAACIGPASDMNPGCVARQKRNSANCNNSLWTLFIIIIQIVFFIIL